MAIELKEIKDAVEDGVQVLKKDWEAKRAEDQKAFDAKVEDVLKKLEDVSRKEDVEKLIAEAKDSMQKQYDEYLTMQNRPGAEGSKKTFSQSMTETLKENHDALVKAAQSGKGVTIDMKAFDWDSFTGADAFNTDYRGPIVNPYGSFHWRNIVPGGSTSKGHLSFPKEGATSGGADTWEHEGSETESKPEISPTFAPYTVKVQWIAGLIKGIPVDMLEDLEWLNSYLNMKAYNELLKAEDAQIQAGTGVDPDLDGFLNGTNSSSYDGTYTLALEQVVDAAARQIADANYNANGVVMSNADKVAIILNKATDSGLYNLPDGAVGYVNGQLNIAGLNVYSNSAMPEGTMLVGDFNQSQFVIRSAPRLRMFDQNATDAEKNQVMLRIEERAALAIFSNLAFVKIEATT